MNKIIVEFRAQPHNKVDALMNVYAAGDLMFIFARDHFPNRVRTRCSFPKLSVKIRSLIIGLGAPPMGGKKVRSTETSDIW